MELKHTVVTQPTYSVDYSDFTAFVEKHLNVTDYDFVQDEEVRNDSTTPVRCQEVVNDADRANAERLLANWDTSHWRPAGRIMDALRLRGLVEPGLYLIKVCW